MINSDLSLNGHVPWLQVSTSSAFESSETKILTDADTIGQASFILVLYKEDVGSRLPLFPCPPARKTSIPVWPPLQKRAAIAKRCGGLKKQPFSNRRWPL